MRAIAISLLFCLSLYVGAQSAPKQKSAKFWTPAEEAEYQGCLSKTHFGHSQKEVEDYCLLDEEHKRWMRHHPEARTRAEDKVKWQECIAANKEKFNNGTRDEVRAIFDQCESRAYGVR